MTTAMTGDDESPDSERFVTLKEAAEILDCTVDLLQQVTSKGALRSKRIGHRRMVYRTSVESWREVFCFLGEDFEWLSDYLYRTLSSEYPDLAKNRPLPRSAFVTVSQAADKFGVDSYTVRRWIAKGLIPSRTATFSAARKHVHNERLIPALYIDGLAAHLLSFIIRTGRKRLIAGCREYAQLCNTQERIM